MDNTVKMLNTAIANDAQVLMDGKCITPFILNSKGLLYRSGGREWHIEDLEGVVFQEVVEEVCSLDFQTLKGITRELEIERCVYCADYTWSADEHTIRYICEGVLYEEEILGKRLDKEDYSKFFVDNGSGVKGFLILPLKKEFSVDKFYAVFEDKFGW